MRTVLYGGSFDPIHHAHLAVAYTALCEPWVDRVVFVPCGTPPHKRLGLYASAEHRLRMLQLATNRVKGFEISTLEIEREGPSYTWVTVQTWHETCPDDEVWLLIGADSLVQLPEWRHPERIVQQARLLLAERPGVDLTKVAEWLLPFIDRLPSPQLDLSSSEIRARCAASASIRYLVPDPVFRYIIKHKLYTQSSGVQ